MASQEIVHSDSDSDTPLQGSFYSSQTNHLSPQQRTQILRDCHVKVKELENNITTKTPEYLEPIVKEVDRINQDGTMEEKIQNSEEVVLDSKIVCSASNIIKKCSANLLRDFSNYDSVEFAQKIEFTKRMPDTVGEENIDWSLLGKKIIHNFNKTAKFTMLLGTFRLIARKEIIKRKTVRVPQAPTKRPENVISLDKVEDSVEETVNGIKKIIKNYQKRKGPVDFFALVLHPTSYGKTIENMLHTSFLIRDGFVKFTVDEEGIPYVENCTGEKDQSIDKNKRNRITRNIQNVLSLNMHQWKALVKAYAITEPMIDLESKKSKHTT
ncbi:non-structural maintenance of chromosomes element 4 homolog A-like isoform X2 [Phymastichus coffea]|uniref:non-structural maintenance of chromosomes element 4 homolog A-like isoform X2 n=1 Tax=Phymastichus coffea TaxID=108790 RepID=UPI00273B72DF|nr:non-structural maintenance of chromosomes element 4 homolog A-like isoform X2 [Phymastichus coffea]